jgi:hypothetical protein
MAAARAEVRPAPTSERLARSAERVLRIAGDGRVGAALLAVTGLANLVAAFIAGGPRLLEGLPYALLLGALALSGVAAVAVRAPSAWREWRRPGPVQRGTGAVEASLASGEPELLLAALGAGIGFASRRSEADDGRSTAFGAAGRGSRAS